MTDIASLTYDINSSDAVSAAKNLDKMDDAADRSTKSQSRLTKSSKASSAAIAGVTRAAGIAVAALGAIFASGSIVREIEGFGTAMSGVAAVTRASTSDMLRMTEVARELGATTEFSAAQAADGLRFLGMAGFDASEAVAALPSVLDLATASGMGLASAADIASNIMSGFNVNASESSRVVDVLAAASSSANTDVMQLGDAMKFAAPVAASLGISIEDTAAAIGVLSDAGLQGSQAGTGLRSVMASLLSPTNDANSALKSMGLTVDDINPATNELSVVMGRLSDSGLNAELAIRLFGREAASAGLVLASSASRVGEFGDELERAGGAAGDMAGIMRDNLGGDLASLKSAISGLILTVGDEGLTGAIRGMVQGLTSGFQFLSSIVEQSKGFIIAATVALTVSFIPAIYAAITATGVWIASLVTLRGVLITTGVGAFIVAAGILINKFILLSEVMGGVGDVVSEFGQLFNLTFQGMQKVVESFKLSWRAFTSYMYSIWITFVARIMQVWATFLDDVALALSYIPMMEDQFNAVAGAALGAAARVSALQVNVENARIATTALANEASTTLATAFDPAIKKAAQLWSIIRSVMSSGDGDAPKKGHKNKPSLVVPTIPSIDIPSIGLGAGAGGGGGGDDTRNQSLDSLIESLRNERETIEAWHQEQSELIAQYTDAELAAIGGKNEAKLRLEQEYQERMSAIRGGYQGDALSQTETFMGQMATALSGGNDKMAKASAVFGAVEATINAYRAFNQTLADPSLPWFAKIPAAVSVLAAGMKTVSAIKSAGSSGSSGGGSSYAPSSASGTTSTATPEKIVRVSIHGDEWIANMIEPMMAKIYDETADGTRVVFDR